MSDLFTIKLDLSAVIRNGNEKLYILMVDPTRMKMIYQFKLWVRFLFSIDCPIKLVYEGAAIHDLEDVHILTLLKTVCVELTDTAVGETEHHEELIAKLNRYDEWRESVTPAITPQKQCELTNGNNLQTQSGGPSRHLGISKTESDDYNKTNLGCERQQESALQYSRCNGSKCDTKNKSTITNNKFNSSSNSCFYEQNDIDCYNSECTSDARVQKDDCPNEPINATSKIEAVTPKVRNQACKQKSSGKRSQKPFSLYNFLQTLRSQESNFDEHKTNVNGNTMELVKNDDFSVSDAKPNYKICQVEEDTEQGQLVKRKRKRVRKHKSQKNKNNSQQCISMQRLTPQHELMITSVSVSPKPKHIRFDENEENTDCVANKPMQEEFIISNDQSNECLYNSKDELSTDHKFDMITSTQQNYLANASNSIIAARVEVFQDLQENDENEVEVKHALMTGDKEEIKNGSLSDSPQSIMDIFGSLRKKKSTPPVFDRFSACI